MPRLKFAANGKAQDSGRNSALARFYDLGEAAWQEFRRTGVSYSVDEVCDRVQLRVDARRRQLLNAGADVKRP